MTDFICNDLIEMVGTHVVKAREIYELAKLTHRVKLFEVNSAIKDIGIYRNVDNDKCIKVSLFAMKQNINQNWLRNEYVCDCCLEKVMAFGSHRCGTCEGIFCYDCIGNFSGDTDCDQCAPENN